MPGAKQLLLKHTEAQLRPFHAENQCIIAHPKAIKELSMTTSEAGHSPRSRHSVEFNNCSPQVRDGDGSTAAGNRLNFEIR